MVSEIKLDHIDSVANAQNAKKNQATPQKNGLVTSESDGIEIHLSAFDAMVADNSMQDDQARVDAVKHLINTNNYRVNQDALAEKLYQHLFKIVR